MSHVFFLKTTSVQDSVRLRLATNMCYMTTPFKRILSSQEFLISSARALSSSTSQLTQTNLPLRNFASDEASHTVNCPASSAAMYDISQMFRVIEQFYRIWLYSRSSSETTPRWEFRPVEMTPGWT